jgi:hypothetical protein
VRHGGERLWEARVRTDSHQNPQQSPAAAPLYSLLPSVAHRDVAGEIFVITADRGFHRLEAATAVLLFRLLAGGPRSAAELQEALVANFEVDPAVAHHDIAEFLLILEARQIAAADRSDAVQASAV